MKEILGIIDAAIRTGSPVNVRCLGGAGRTGIVAGCCLARYGIEGSKSAPERIRELRSREAHALIQSPETAHQRPLCADGA